ncbi:MAG: glutathione-dependent reductase [Oceanospirillaceae bacterium]|nr:glutathione-dependent reductase [Oceanospirillaceae bacterium]MBT13835.1 glutathione-dependent reductase [Oceanospirillaceae bacterium]|tara:strand:- start:47630 stop:48625 length:996 start_codon:yes stop_codon:yes gene_type:complete
MGLLVNGQWQDKWYDTEKSGGAFVREDARLRNWVTADGSAGPTGTDGFKAESGRYHLYVSYACPWAHRTLIFRQLKGLRDHISVSVVATDMLENGWTFDTQNGSSGDDLFHSDFLHQIYTRNQADYSGRVTVPVLWDKQQNCIVSNESSEIIRMLNSAFNGITGNSLDFYPEPLQQAIDEVNERVYNKVNNGVYKAGFATSFDKYQAAFESLFDTLDWLEQRLTGQRWLVADNQGVSHLTEADWRLFTTLVRFDAVYVGHFKCNLKRIADYPALSAYLRDLYQYPGVDSTVHIDHIKRHYYASHHTINPTGIVPIGPELDFSAPHNRQTLL